MTTYGSNKMINITDNVQTQTFNTKDLSFVPADRIFIRVVLQALFQEGETKCCRLNTGRRDTERKHEDEDVRG